MVLYVPMIFDVPRNEFLDVFSFSNLVVDSILAKMFWKKCLVTLAHRFTHVDLVDLYIQDFYVILSMDWLDFFYDSIDCKTRLVKFLVSIWTHPVVERGKGESLSYLKARKNDF